MAKYTKSLGKRMVPHGLDRVDMDHMHDDVEHGDRWPYLLAGGVAAIYLSFWLSVQIASLISFHWIPVSAGIIGAARGLIGLPQHLLHPGAGWPKNIRGDVAPFYLFWPVIAAVAYGEYRYARRIYFWWLDRNRGIRGETGWATERDLETIWNSKKNDKLDDGVILGISQGGKLLKLERRSHALVVAGTQSGKTAGLCIPALLTYPGVVIATSVKNDLVENTLKRRRELGEVFIFDPVGAMGMPEDEIAGWTPLNVSRDWRDAQRTADALIEVAMNKGESGGGNMEFFKAMSRQTLPVLLYAAAVMDEDMRRVIRWLYRINDQTTHAEIDSILRWKNHVKALDAWVGFVTKEAKLRGDIAATMASALVSYEDEKVQKNAMKCDITPESLFNGKPNTLYVVAPMAEQARLEPIFVALMQSLLLAVSEMPKPLAIPLLCVLDEAANIAALPLLPEFLSMMGSQNVSIITAWQDFSQIKSRYGEKRNTILNNSRAKMVLPGVADPETLQYFSQVTGETIEEQVSVSGSRKQKQLSVGETRRSLLSVAAIREQKIGEAIIVYGHMPPAKIKLRMWFKDRDLKRLAAGVGGVASLKRGFSLEERLPQLAAFFARLAKLKTFGPLAKLSERQTTVISRPVPRPAAPARPTSQVTPATPRPSRPTEPTTGAVSAPPLPES